MMDGEYSINEAHLTNISRKDEIQKLGIISQTSPRFKNKLLKKKNCIHQNN